MTIKQRGNHGVFRIGAVIVFISLGIILLCSSAAFSLLYAYFNHQRNEAQEIEWFNELH
jgi:hypothetical protein